MQYRIVDTTINHFSNIVIDYNFDNYDIGDEVDFLGQKLHLTQTGTIVCLSNGETAITLLTVTED